MGFRAYQLAAARKCGERRGGLVGWGWPSRASAGSLRCPLVPLGGHSTMQTALGSFRRSPPRLDRTRGARPRGRLLDASRAATTSCPAIEGVRDDHHAPRTAPAGRVVGFTSLGDGACARVARPSVRRGRPLASAAGAARRRARAVGGYTGGHPLRPRRASSSLRLSAASAGGKGSVVGRRGLPHSRRLRARARARGASARWQPPARDGLDPRRSGNNTGANHLYDGGRLAVGSRRRSS